MPGIGISPFKFLRRGSSTPRVIGLTIYSATSPFPNAINTVFYNFDAGVINTIDESPTYEVVATTNPLIHAGEPITVKVPDKFEIMTSDNVWHSSDFSHILGDGTGSTPSAQLKFRVKSGNAVGTYVKSFDVEHFQLPSAVTVFSTAGRVKTAVHATTIAWQSALAGTKPSGILLFYLDDLISGVDSDGDLVEMDYFHMVRGMETDEQRLKPLKSTAGLDADLVGSGAAADVFDRTGIKCTAATQKGMRIKWKPITNKVKVSQDNNSLFVTFSGSTAGSSTQFYCGIAGAGSVNWNLGKNAGGTMNNTRAWTSGFSSGGSHTANAFFGIRRTSSTAYESYINGTTSAASTNTSAAVSDVYFRMPGNANNSDSGDMIFPHTTALLHCIGIGSNAVTFGDVRSRLNTYYTGLGFSTI